MVLDMNQAYSVLTADLEKKTPGYQPNPMQAAVWQKMNDMTLGTALLLKSVTGSGKTEAVSVPALARQRRLIMVYPTRSLVEDQVSRFANMLANWSRHTHRVTSLVIDTGAQSLRCQWKNGAPLKPPTNPRRHLYHGDVVITTLDKFLYRFFAFGEPQKGYTFPLRIAYGLRQPLICFDEAHSYDEVAFTNFQRLVRTLYERGRDIALMTATMSQAHEACFDYLDVVDYAGNPTHTTALQNWQRQANPHIPYHPEKILHYFPESITPPPAPKENSPAVARIIQLAQSHAAPDRRLIVVVESVKEAVAVFQALRQTVSSPSVQLYHGRLADNQRRCVYQKIAGWDKKEEGYILVTTSAVEVGCDLDAHLLITQLCDPDRLVQRAGRCNRRQKTPRAQVFVVGDALPEWMTALPESERSRYIQALAAQDGHYFQPQALLEQFFRPSVDADPRVETMFDMLYEYVYEANLVNKKLHQNGLIITRSWEPTLTLYRGRDEQDGLVDAITVPIARCRIPKDGQPTAFLTDLSERVNKQVYDSSEKKFRREPLGGWENGYKVDILVDLQDDDTYDPELGYVKLPALFQGPFRAGAKRILKYEYDGRTSIIWYLDPQDVASQPYEQITTAVSGTEPEADNAETTDDEGDADD